MDPRTTTMALLLLLLLGLCGAQSAYENETLLTASATEDITTTILRMNNEFTEMMLEGDLVIPKKKNAKKCFKNSDNCRWPKSPSGNVVVPYLLSRNYDYSEGKEILDAMNEIQSRTCIRFVQRWKERAYLSIEPRFGCASLLGYNNDKLVVSLQRFGCIQRGVILHELLHALGFAHEQNRSDRDKYVKIIWENIDLNRGYNFQKKDTENLNTPYDYSSVMHYGRTAFGKDNRETIIPIPDASVPIGQRSGLSDIDTLRINRLYKC